MEQRYNIRKIAKVAQDNMYIWVDIGDLKRFVEESKNKKYNSYDEYHDRLYDFFSKRIGKFFTLLNKSTGIEKQFLDENLDEIIYNIIEMSTLPPVTDRNEVSDMKIGSREEDNEDPIISKALRQSREKEAEAKLRPKDYSKMSQYDLKKEVDKALDSNDFDTLKKIQPFLKEGFLKYHVDDILNEEYLMKPLREGCGCGSKKNFFRE